MKQYALFRQKELGWKHTLVYGEAWLTNYEMVRTEARMSWQHDRVTAWAIVRADGVIVAQSKDADVSGLWEAA